LPLNNHQARTGKDVTVFAEREIVRTWIENEGVTVQRRRQPRAVDRDLYVGFRFAGRIGHHRNDRRDVSAELREAHGAFLAQRAAAGALRAADEELARFQELAGALLLEAALVIRDAGANDLAVARALALSGKAR